MFTRRISGAQFVNGIWPIRITAEFGVESGEYMGTIDVGQSVPTAPPPKSVAAPMHGTTGEVATIVGSSE